MRSIKKCITLSILLFYISLTASAQYDLSIKGTFSADPGITRLEFGTVIAKGKDQVLQVLPVFNQKFKVNIKVTGTEMYFIKHNNNTSYFELGPGIANITLKDSLLSATTIKDNSAYSDWQTYIDILASDTNFTNGRRAMASLDNYRAGKNVDPVILKTKEQALEAAELLSSKTNMTYVSKWLIEQPASWANSKVLFTMIGRAPDHFINEAFLRLPDSLKNNSSARLTKYWIDSLSVGGKFPKVTYNDPTAHPVNLASLSRHRYTLIDFWASWCIPCRQKLPKLAAVYKKYKDRDFEMVGVSVDHDNPAWLSAIKSDDLYWPQLTGERNDVDSKFFIRAIPANYLLDHTGKIVGRNLSAADLSLFLAKKL